MDAVCLNGSWDVVIAKDLDGNVEGVLVYHFRKYRGFKLILMPPLTFYNGIYFNYRKNIKPNSKIGFEIKITEKLLGQLPKHDLYYQQYSTEVNNWLPQYWAGYQQSTRYTYTLSVSDNTEELWSNLKGNVRRNIKKAEAACEVINTDVETFWNELERSYSQRKNPFQKQLIERLYNNLSEINSCQLHLVRHKESKKILAGSFIAYDNNVSYYVCGFFNPDGKEIGALSYLLWNNITNSKTKQFDFEGSMIQEVEYFFRAFGGNLTPHYRIWKVNSWLLRLIFKFKNLPFIN